jgi:hypothetical protein
MILIFECLNLHFRKERCIIYDAMDETRAKQQFNYFFRTCKGSWRLSFGTIRFRTCATCETYSRHKNFEQAKTDTLSILLQLFTVSAIIFSSYT